MAKTVEETVQGSSGGQALVEQRGPEYMAEIGSRGGQAVVKRYGKNYMSLLGTIGADAQNDNLSKTRRTNIGREIRRILKEKG